MPKATTAIKKESAIKREREYKSEAPEPEVDNSPLASTLAAKHIINPPEGKLQEVSYLSMRLLHDLTMLQAYENHVPRVIEQIKERRYWYLNRYIKRLKARNEWTQEIEDAAKEEIKESIAELDSIDLNELFIHSLRTSVYQHSRGKDGKFVESLIILGDTQLQTANGDDGMSDFNKPVRSQ